MKRIFSCTIASLILASSMTFAASNNTTITNSTSFAPVTWVANKANGGFSLFNASQKMMYVQVSIDKGDVAVYTDQNKQIGCKCDDKICILNPTRGLKSVICQVYPNERLAGDYDFAETREATGTYQVLFTK